MGYRLWVIGCLGAVLTACATYQKPPIDDAYYWADKQDNYASQTSETRGTSQTGPTGTSIEYLNVQDTTVTIRIRK